MLLLILDIVLNLYKNHMWVVSVSVKWMQGNEKGKGEQSGKEKEIMTQKNEITEMKVLNFNQEYKE